MNQHIHNTLISAIWSISDDCLRDVYARKRYRDVILPMVVLCRLDALLSPTKDAGNTWTLQRLHDTNNPQHLLANAEDYLNGFSGNTKEIVRMCKLREQIRSMAANGLLLNVIGKFTSPYINLSPFAKNDPDGRKLPPLTNAGMGYVLRALIRKFNQETPEEAGEGFPVREVIDLMARIAPKPEKGKNASIHSNLKNKENAYKLIANEDFILNSTKINGAKFIIDREEASALITLNPANEDVIFLYIDSKYLNKKEYRYPNHYLIYFQDWPLRRYTQVEWDELPENERNNLKSSIEKGEKITIAPPDYTEKVAADFPDCLAIIAERVNPGRQQKNDTGEFLVEKSLSNYWYHFFNKSSKIYLSKIDINKLIVIPYYSNYCNFNIVYHRCKNEPAYIFNSNKNMLLLTVNSDYDAMGYYAILQSFIAESWVGEYCPNRGTGAVHYAAYAFATFPFPPPVKMERLKMDGELHHYRTHRLIRLLKLTPSEIFNAMHTLALHGRFVSKEWQHSKGESDQADMPNPAGGDAPRGRQQDTKPKRPTTDNLRGLSKAAILKRWGKQAWHLWNHTQHQSCGLSFNTTVAEIAEVRVSQIHLDRAVLRAYGWFDLWPRLRHGYYEVDHLPAHDRVRFTVHPDARQEILKRLLALNHARHAEEVAAGLHTKKKPAPNRLAAQDTDVAPTATRD